MSSASQQYVRPHILIVTDDEDLKAFLSEGLVVGGFWVSAVASALQTLEVFRLRTFDLAILDLALGGMNALELLKRLRSAKVEGAPRTDIPIVAIADDAASDEAQDALKTGADDVLVPPIELEALLPHLFEIVKGWRAAHPGRPYADELAQSTPGTGSD